MPILNKYRKTFHFFQYHTQSDENQGGVFLCWNQVILHHKANFTYNYNSMFYSIVCWFNVTNIINTAVLVTRISLLFLQLTSRHTWLAWQHIVIQFFHLSFNYIQTTKSISQVFPNFFPAAKWQFWILYLFHHRFAICKYCFLTRI